MSYDPYQSQGATSGTANVAIGQSTGSQYQGADISDNLTFPYSGQSETFYTPIQFASGASMIAPGVQSGAPGGPLASCVFSIANTTLQNSGVNPIGSSGGGNVNVVAVGSGSGTIGGSGGTLFAAGSGVFCPMGFFYIQVPTSGNPVVKVPFFNS